MQRREEKWVLTLGSSNTSFLLARLFRTNLLALLVGSCAERISFSSLFESFILEMSIKSESKCMHTSVYVWSIKIVVKEKGRGKEGKREIGYLVFSANLI